MCAPSPPPAPDYQGAAAAQGDANLYAAIAQQVMGNVNQVNPWGTQTFEQTGSQNIGGPGGGPGSLSFEDWIAANPNQHPDPMFQQANYQEYLDNQPGGSGGYNVPTYTSTTTLSPEIQALFDQYNQNQLSQGQAAGNLLGGLDTNPLDFSGVEAVPGDYEGTRQKVLDAMMGRATEQTGVQREQKQSDLIAAGIRPGTKAYADAMFAIDRGFNDARSQAELSAGSETARAYGMDADRRKQAIAEIVARRQIPINEINALTRGGQVQNPFATGGGGGGGQVAPAPVAQAYGAQQGFNTDIYNQQTAYAGQQQATAASMAMMAAYLFSDRRLKTDVERIGTHQLGFGIYRFRYLWDRVKRIGVMAQEVLPIMPEAVVLVGGYYAVNYGMLNGRT